MKNCVHLVSIQSLNELKIVTRFKLVLITLSLFPQQPPTYISFVYQSYICHGVILHILQICTIITIKITFLIPIIIYSQIIEILKFFRHLQEGNYSSKKIQIISNFFTYEK